MTSEQVLTAFFVACSLVCWMNVRALLRDKCVNGCAITPAWIFLSTNSYEVWYFGALNQPLASLGAVSMVGANLTWIGLAYYYRWANSVTGQINETLDLQR